MRFSKAVCFLAVVMVAYVPAALAQGTYKKIDVPGALQTLVTGINAAGDVVGTYQDANMKWHGFFLREGTFTTIDYSPGVDTETYGINDLGQIVGVGGLDGFLYDMNTQLFTILTPPGGHSFVAPFAINSSGTIVGTLQLNRVHRGYPVGFVWNSGTYQIVLPKRSEFGEANGINSLGQVVGTGFGDLPSQTINFILDRGKFYRVEVQAELVNGINDSGTIVGTYRRANDVVVGFVLAQDGTPQQLIFPSVGVNGTLPYSINNSGVIAGSFLDTENTTEHGFIWTPPADPVKK